MSTVYSLQFSDQIFPFRKKVQICHSKTNENVSQYFVHLDDELYTAYINDDSKWHRDLALNNADNKQVIYFPKILKDKESLLLLKTNKGIDIYQYIDGKFNILLSSNEYHPFDTYENWNKPENNVKCGHIYSDENLIGILSKNRTNGLQFHAVIENDLKIHKNPFYSLDDSKLEILRNSDTSKALFFLADLKRQGRENVIVRNRQGLNVYEFNKESVLRHFLEVPGSSKTNDSKENIFFPDLTGQPLKDIVLFNTSGLFVYQYDSEKSNYQIIDYNPLFNEQRGWNEKYIDTVHFQDINFDGKQEMLFTGPQGMDILTFDNTTSQWQSVLDVSDIAIPQRHSYIVDVVPSSSVNTDPILFMRHQNEMHWAKIVKKPLYDLITINDDSEELPNQDSSNISTTLSVIPKSIKSSIADEIKPNVLLRDQLDYSPIINGVDTDTGKASFKLPLIGLPSFPKDEKLNLYYNGNHKDSSILGIGWSFPISAIMMHHQGSIFPENEKYFLLLENVPQFLIIDSDNSTDNIYNFKLSDKESKTQIRYFKNEERWEIDYMGTKQIYGRRGGSDDHHSISYDLTWKYWRGVGSSLSNQVELATVWFLTELRSGEDRALYYTYDIHNESVPESGKKFTRDVYLKTISDTEDDEIIFNYATKDSEEYNLPSLINARGNYNTMKVQTRYLTGYSLTTYNYRQDIKFTYEVENGNRLLTKIEQDNDPTNLTVLQFFYKKVLNSHELERVILPTATSVEFNYETIGGTSNIIEKIDLQCDVKNSYNVDYGQDFVLISYLNNYNHVVLKMFNIELTNEIYSSLSESESQRFPFFGNNAVYYYEVKILEEAIVLILNYGDYKDVCLIHKEKNKWSINPKYFNYDKDAEIQFGNNFVAVLDAPKVLLEIIVWDNKSKEWIKENIESRLIENSADSLLKVSDKVFFTYDDNVVTVAYRNKKNVWLTKTIIILPGVISTIKDTLDKFDLQTHVYKHLMHYLKNNAFQIGNNLLLINRWSIEDTKIYSEVSLYTLNSKYDAVYYESFKVSQGNVTEITKENYLQLSDKIKVSYTLAYKKDGEKFKIFIKSFNETNQEKIKEFCKDNNNDKNCEADVKNQIEQTFVDIHKNDFILNLQKYFAYLRSSIVTCGNATFTFIGDKWNKGEETGKDLKSEKWSISLNDKFIFEKENSESSIKLYEQDKYKSKQKILDLEVKNMNQIFNMYPKYLVYKTESEDMKVLFFELLDKTIKKFPLPQGEVLSLKSNYNILITHKQSAGDNETLTLNLRQLSHIKRNLPNAVIKKLTVNFDNDYKRITGYDYDASSVKLIGDTLYYEKTYIIPGNQKSSYGFIESKIITDPLNIIKKTYDAQGNLIKIDQKEQSNNTKEYDPEETENMNSVLYDMTGKLKVAQFHPYAIQDDEVGYYGFEDYEVNKIGVVNSSNQNHWYFNESSVVKREFSLTGENYLSLTNGTLVGLFEPRDQNQTYVASCWVRSQKKDFQNNAFSLYLKATLFTEKNQTVYSYLSEVKYQFDDWNYLEVVIDLLYSKLVYKNLVSSANLSEVPVEKPLKIMIVVSPNINSTLDVDHIRFSPLNSDFQATTYNSKTKEIKEVINTNGLIKRYFYNDYQDQIGIINENGEIEKFHTHTKGSSIDRIVNLKSKIEIQSNGGFYEDFHPYSFTKRWEVDNDKNWQIAPSEIHHISNQFNQLKLRNTYSTLYSYGIRLYFSLQSESSVIRFNDILELKRKGNEAFVIFAKQERGVPTQGEILLISEHNRLMVWIDGGLYFDEGGLDKLLFNVQMYGKVKVRDLLVFIEPSIHVTYFNALDEKVQEINLESANSVIITEFLYDELGRPCITTKPMRLQRSVDEPVIAYYSDYVTNKNPFSIDSVWKLGRLQGEFEVLNPHNYYQVTYNDNPLNENTAIGLPGQEFSVKGKFAKQFSWSTEDAFINKHYPVDQNYRHYVEHKLGGVEFITVFDKKDNKVATLHKTPGQKDLFATYEYNDDGQLIQMLSPLYHNTADSSAKIGFITSNLECFSEENNEKQDSLRVANSYDNMGNVITKTSPDSGKVEYLYNNSRQLKYTIFYSSFNSTAAENVIYFDYDNLGRLTNTGKLISPPTKELLLNLTLTENNTEEYQVFYHSDFERQPRFRGRLKRTITRNDGIPFIEESLLNEDKSLSSKRIIIKNENFEDPLVIAINKIYRAKKLTEIEYPTEVQGETFKVTYTYDKLGRIEGIGTPTKNNVFVKYTYNSDGLIETEHHLPDRINLNFTRKHNYNSASYLTQMTDKFLTENIYYTTGSYGDHGYGDGTITRTEFEATWHQYADSDKISLNEQSFVSEFINPEASELCFNKLKSAGYINQYNHQAKIYYPLFEVDFPRICSEGITGRQIQTILGKQGFPSKYGHLYNYGAYQELIKAKYFVGEEIPVPLQPNTFSKLIPNVTVSTSYDIWKTLSSAGYIIPDRIIPDKILNNDTSFKPHGKKGSSFIRSTLFDDLKAISDNYKHYRLPLEKALAYYFSKKQNLLKIKENLKKSFSEWSQVTTDNKKIQEILKIAKIIMDSLDKKGYLNNPFDKRFNDLLKKHEKIIPEIVEVLFKHFGRELGEAEFDVESYEIDENGNHKHFYNGFERYQLKYRCNSNQINTINFQSFALPKQESEFSIKHDSRGNVVQALHKGIKNITYHSVSNRVASIELIDGKKLIFHYDGQGERIFKRFLDITGDVKKEVSYVRDEFGRSLVEREVTWNSPTLPPSVLVTIFIYGPKGLVGFIRRDQYYSVITDHEGSIRLVIKDGEVVAAYDYLPYGNLMRQYGINSESHISYRYIGQEWDEETDLYNYHARFYDPSIGRFYQHDPKMQYFSPYKYAGNSPVSLIDPDGELAFLLIFLIIALGAAGVYLEGAAVSGTWNPIKWNFKDPKLWLRIIFGGIGGALLPVMLPLSVETFVALGLSKAAGVALTATLGAVGVYAGMARSANEWDPTKWDYSRPELWNGAFEGFQLFAEAPGVIRSAVNFYKSFSSIYSKGAFITGSAVSFSGLITVRVKSKEYDFSKPDFYYDVLESFLFSADIPMAATSSWRFLKKNGVNILEQLTTARDVLIRKHFNRYLRSSTGLADNSYLHAMMPQLNSIFKSLSKTTIGIAIPSLALVLIAKTHEGGLDLTQSTTYEALINYGLMFSSLSAHAYSSYKNRRIKIKKNIVRMMAKGAETSANKYIGEIIKRNLLPNGKEEIPNRVVAVAVMDDGAMFVAYSGLEGPGYLSSFINGKEYHIILPENRRIGNSDININEITNDIHSKIKEHEKELKNANYNNFLKQQGEITAAFKKLRSQLDEHLRSSIEDSDIKKIMNKIAIDIKNKGYVHQNKILPIEQVIEKLKARNIEFNKEHIGPLSKKLGNIVRSGNISKFTHAQLNDLKEIDGQIRTYAKEHKIPIKAMNIAQIEMPGQKVKELQKMIQQIKEYKVKEFNREHIEPISTKFEEIVKSGEKSHFRLTDAELNNLKQIDGQIRTLAEEHNIPIKGVNVFEIEMPKEKVKELQKRLQRITIYKAEQFNKEHKALFQPFSTKLVEIVESAKKSDFRLTDAELNDLNEIDGKIVTFEKEHKMTIKSANVAEIKMHEQKVKALQHKIEKIKNYNDEQITSFKNNWNKIYAEIFKTYFDKFAHWVPINCAEPHCILFFMRTLDVFPDIGKFYHINNVKYMGAFSIEGKTQGKIELERKKRCSNCEVTTEPIKNIVTDEPWNIMIEMETKKLPITLFFTYHNITYIPVRNITNKGYVSTRRKRSIVDNYINNQDLHFATTDDSDYISENSENNASYLENDKSTDNAQKEMNIFAGNLFGWIKTSFNQLFDSKKILPETASMPKMLKGITDSKNSLRESTALVDVNSTILLLDTVMRKITGQKYISGATDNDASLLEARGYSLDVGLAFEKTMKYAASKSGISMHRFNIHYMNIQEKFIDKIMSGRLDEIADILISHAEKALPLREKGCPGKLSPKKFNKFINVFSKIINIELNEIMQTNKTIKGIL